METLDLIQDSLRNGELLNNPSLCADHIATLSGELSFYISMQGEIEKNRATQWLSMRKDHKSDTATDRAWSLTEKGIEYEWYESRIKRIKAILTGLKTIIRKCELESMNLN